MADDKKKVWASNSWDQVNALAKAVGEPVKSNGFEFVPGSLDNASFLKSQGMPTGTSTVTSPTGQVSPTPEVKALAQAAVNDPQGLLATQPDPPDGGNIIDTGKQILGNLFNSEDEADWKIGPVGLQPVENVWDGFLRGMGWTYNSISQLTAAGLSGLPGGIPTLTWDEAYSTSVGQVGLANAAIGLKDMGQGNLVGGAISFASGGILNSINALYQSAADPENQVFDDPNFDIRDPEQRKRAFEDNALNKWSTGLTDAVFTLAADPLIVGGKALKIARLRYIDRPLTEANVATLKQELADGSALAAAGTDVGMAPIAKILYDAVTPNPETGARMTMRELEARGEISFSSDSYGIAELVTSVPDNAFDQARLIFEAGLGDAAAMQQLKLLHAQSADDLMNVLRDKLEHEFMTDPTKQAILFDVVYKAASRAENRYNNIQKMIAKDPMSVSPGSIDTALKDMNDTFESLTRLADAKLPDSPLSKINGKWNEKVLEDAKANNKWLTRALDEANPVFNAFRQADRGFATNTRLGRAVSARRARAAAASYETKATLAKGYGTQDFFGNSPFRKTIRVWRKWGVENSTYYVAETATGSSDAIKNLGALADGLRMYAGAGITRTDEFGKTVTVGGIQQKEKILTTYAQTVNGNRNSVKALEELEKAIKKDIIDFYNVDPKVANYIFDTMTQKRTDLRELIVNRQYFPSGMEDGTEVLNKNAFLESQLRQGSYVLPFDEIERTFIKFASGKLKDPIQNGLLTTTQGVTKKLDTAYSAFNELWRPAVLFRLGYPQRNVAEGLFRSMMFYGSVAPLGWAAQAAIKTPQNFRVAQRTAKKVDKISAKLAAPDAARDAFDGAVVSQRSLSNELNQLRVIESNLINRIGKSKNANANKFYTHVDKETGEIFTLAEVKTQMARVEKQLTDVGTTIDNYGGRPVPAGMKGSKFQKWRDKNTAALVEEEQLATNFIDEILKIAGGIGKLTTSDKATVFVLRERIQQIHTQAIILERDDVFALNQYSYQAGARKVVDNGGPLTTPSGMILQSAFGNPRYRDIALRELSANNTVKAVMTLKLNLQNNVFRQKVQEMYVNVTPDMGDAYWKGMSEMLRQYSQSKIGQKILNGDTSEEIATWLVTDDVGKAIIDALDSSFDMSTVTTAGAAIDIIRQGLDVITAGNADVLNVMKTRPPTPAELQRMYPLSIWADRLNPVVGDKTTLTGLSDVKDIYRDVIAKGFNWIGTKPEDAFVRIPFYSKSYTLFRDDALASLRRQYTNEVNIPLDLIARIEVAAHRKALKDTKDWLYTIDRRTMLGKYGEYVSPFISATQNSVTALSRLTRRDPAVPGMMLAIWNAPNDLGWEDDDGNLIIPLPKELIPDGVENFFGLDAMSNVSVPKASLNVIFPETGFGFVPRSNPLVQVAASELMKKGFLGLGVEAPDLMVQSFGKKDADTFWAIWKDWLYGEGQGISDETWSWDKVTPAAFNKFVQLVKGDSSKQYAYQYALQARSEDLLFQAGYRDEYPKPQEIMDRTNGQFLLRWLGNMLAYTPPEYVSIVQPLIDMQSRYDNAYGLNGPMRFSQAYGNELLALGSTDTTKNVGGVLTSADSVRNIKQYEGLIRNVSPMVKEDPSTLGILVNSDDPEAPYDVNALRWLSTNNIPGLSRPWRELVSGPEALNESQRQAGWVEYTKFMNQLDALLENAGLANYQLSAAKDLNSMRKAFIDDMMNNPNYYGWAMDYKNAGSTKTVAAVNVITEALKDEQFMADHQGDLTWIQANNYIGARQEVMAAVLASGKPMSNEINDSLREEWASFRQKLIANDVGWGNIANRYLTGDDNPDIIPVSFNQEVYNGG